MRRRPFSITPDPRFLYLSGGHQEALAHLLYAIVDGGGFVLLTGEIGTGKTSVCRYALDQMPKKVDVALIVNPELTKFELLATLCDEFGVAYSPKDDSRKELLDRLNAYLIDANARGRHSIVMIDEAQNLAPDVLEQLRLLTNLETDRRKLLQIILVGQPELNAILRRHDLRQLDQRIASRYHLRPLSRQENEAYIMHRLAVAGVTRPVFTPGAIAAVHRHCRGFPRLINILCDRALLGAYAEANPVVSSSIVDAAAAEALPQARRLPGGSVLRRARAASPAPGSRSSWRAIAAVSAMSLGAVVFMGSIFAALSSPTDVAPKVAMAPATSRANLEPEEVWEPESPGPGEPAAAFLPLELLEAGMTDGTAEDVFPRRGAAGCSEKTAGRLAATSKSDEAASTPSGNDEKTGSETRRLECDNLSLAVLPPAR